MVALLIGSLVWVSGLLGHSADGPIQPLSSPGAFDRAVAEIPGPFGGYATIPPNAKPLSAQDNGGIVIDFRACLGRYLQAQLLPDYRFVSDHIILVHDRPFGGRYRADVAYLPVRLNSLDVMIGMNGVVDGDVVFTSVNQPSLEPMTEANGKLAVIGMMQQILRRAPTSDALDGRQTKQGWQFTIRRTKHQYNLYDWLTAEVSPHYTTLRFELSPPNRPVPARAVAAIDWFSDVHKYFGPHPTPMGGPYRKQRVGNRRYAG